VPTIHHRARCKMVGTLRFAHPTQLQRLTAIVARMSGATCGAGVPAYRCAHAGYRSAQFCLRYAAATFRSCGNGPSTRSTSAESQYSLISLILPFSIRQTMQYWLS